MPRQNLNVEGRIVGQCKIRKRGCSSSSSSSFVKNYRLKRAILVGKRGGSSTPVPTWKMNSRSPSLQNEISMKNLPVKGGGGGKDLLSVSARQLAATLWEINEVPPPNTKENLEEKRNKMKMRNRGLVKHLDDPSHSPVSERMDPSKGAGHCRRASVASHKLQLTDYNLGGLKSLHNASIVEIEPQTCGQTPSGCTFGVKTRLKDVRDSLTTCKELVKVLNRICGPEHQHSTSLSLVSALKIELDRARLEVGKLIQEQGSNHKEIDFILKQFAEEKAAWKIKEQDKIHNALMSIARELEIEKKLRRQTERLNKKLGKELANTKAFLSKAVKDLESEKTAREILEQVCDELARGIGEDRTEVEELKKQSAKVREEVEKEREMLQLADLLREERVQMKLSEAKYQFEEKNEAVDKLRSELQSYLRTKAGGEKDDGSPNYDRIKELEEYLKRTISGSCQNGGIEKDEGEVVNEEECGGDDSADSDLQSIELNMDNSRKSYEWSYACGGIAPNDPKTIPLDKIKGRKSISEKTQHRGVSLESKDSNGIKWEFGTKHQESLEGVEGEIFLDLASQAQKKDYEDEIRRYEMIRDLRDHIVSGSGKTSSKGFAASPTQMMLSEGLAVLQGAR
ncbi:unnamed protein product [Ilex paraguariensis]|uniref:Uncharacterized protein n=1 Tax=Ilex paraguariensis TaxID=185542 RepID=A0ABC8SP96_9AQUA